MKCVFEIPEITYIWVIKAQKDKRNKFRTREDQIEQKGESSHPVLTGSADSYYRHGPRN